MIKASILAIWLKNLDKEQMMHKSCSASNYIYDYGHTPQSNIDLAAVKTTPRAGKRFRNLRRTGNAVRLCTTRR